MSSDNGRPSDDELHASLHALLHGGDFGEDEPADEETVRREISRILEKSAPQPTAAQEPPVEGPQESWDRPPSRPRRDWDARPEHRKPPLRNRPRRPAQKRTVLPKSGPGASGNPSSSRGQVSYRLAAILAIACAFGAVGGFLAYLGSHSLPSALLAGGAALAGVSRLLDSLIGADKVHASKRNSRHDA